MAQTSTVYQFEVDLSDVDRGVYEVLSLRVAQHPSEADVAMIARVLAFSLEYVEGMQMGPGVGDGSTPAVLANDLTGRQTHWIEVGTPDGSRLHRARKAVGEVAVYCHKDPTRWLEGLSAGAVFEARSIRLWGLDRAFLQKLVDKLDRRNRYQVSRIEGTIYVEVGGESLSGSLEPLSWPD